jgi:hypothetical protein
MHAHLLDKIEQCSYEQAWLAEERGDAREAADALARITRAISPEGAIAAGYRDLLAGRGADAAPAMAALADTLARSDAFWPRWRAVDARLVAAIAADRAGDRAAAVAHAERALAGITALGGFAKTSFVQRRRGRVLALIAGWRAGDVAARTADALAWARLAGGYDARIAELTGSR